MDKFYVDWGERRKTGGVGRIWGGLGKRRRRGGRFPKD